MIHKYQTRPRQGGPEHHGPASVESARCHLASTAFLYCTRAWLLRPRPHASFRRVRGLRFESSRQTIPIRHTSLLAASGSQRGASCPWANEPENAGSWGAVAQGSFRNLRGTHNRCQQLSGGGAAETDAIARQWPDDSREGVPASPISVTFKSGPVGSHCYGLRRRLCTLRWGRKGRDRSIPQIRCDSTDAGKGLARSWTSVPVERKAVRVAPNSPGPFDRHAGMIAPTLR